MRRDSTRHLLVIACTVLVAHLVLLTWIDTQRTSVAPQAPALLGRVLSMPVSPAPAAPAQPANAIHSQASALPAPTPNPTSRPVTSVATMPSPWGEVDHPPGAATTAHDAAPTPSGFSDNHTAAPAVPGPVSMADSVQLPSSKADYLNNLSPPYPAISRRLGEQGQVLISALISKDGSATQARIEQSSGFQRLDQAALETVRQWRFVPGRRAGVAQDMWFKIPITFTLD